MVIIFVKKMTRIIRQVGKSTSSSWTTLLNLTQTICKLLEEDKLIREDLRHQEGRCKGIAPGLDLKQLKELQEMELHSIQLIFEAKS
jgi:hypothetical protein